MLVSPAEPKALCALGVVSTLPEEHGVDFLMLAAGKFVGVQRKTMADFVASTYDGRLADLKAKSTELGRVVLLLEGFFWEDFGVGVQLGIQAEGFWIVQTRNLEQTAVVLGDMERWFAKPSHGSLFVAPRSKEPVGVQHWRTLGAGPGRAKNLYDTFGSPFVMRDDLDEKALMGVNGIGKVLAARLLKAGRNGTD